MTPAAKSNVVKNLARELGFSRAGVTPAGPVADSAFYRQWVALGYSGTMEYLRRNAELRQNPASLLPGARSIICVALSHHRTVASDNHKLESPDVASGALARPRPPQDTRIRQNLQPPKTTQPAPEPAIPTGRIAQYARGQDYHVVMRKMLNDLLERMHTQIAEPFDARVFVDTGPLLERGLARAAGLGWVGKNTMLMHQELGSHLFLAEIITTLELAPDQPIPDHCGTCTRCLDACPTDAFPAPYQLDASRCISYFTIEHRADIPAEFHEQIGDWVFGCDICQDVCPFNTRAPLATHPQIAEERTPPRLPLLDLLHMTAGDHKRLTRGTAMNRAKRSMWQRNAAIALKNANAAKTR